MFETSVLPPRHSRRSRASPRVLSRADDEETRSTSPCPAVGTSSGTGRCSALCARRDTPTMAPRLAASGRRRRCACHGSSPAKCRRANASDDDDARDSPSSFSSRPRPAPVAIGIARNSRATPDSPRDVLVGPSLGPPDADAAVRVRALRAVRHRPDRPRRGSAASLAKPRRITARGLRSE